MTITAPRPEELAVEPSRRLSQVLWRWVSDVSAVLGGRQPLALAPYTVTKLPDAAKWKRHAIIVTNEAGGEVMAVSDGTNWRRQTDRAVVS